MDKISLIGKQFGRLTVLAYSHVKQRSSWWLCKCDCGNETTVARNKLVSAHTKSCGCLFIEQPNALKHGQSETGAYNTWRQMRYRCNNPNHPRYADYGGRGITVCPEWESFEKFYADMGPGANDCFRIERKDNNKGYYKDNCEWATAKTQANNRRT